MNPNVSMGIKLAVARCLYIARASDPTVHAHTRKNSCILHQFLIRSQNSSSSMADENKISCKLWYSIKKKCTLQLEIFLSIACGNIESCV